MNNDDYFIKIEKIPIITKLNKKSKYYDDFKNLVNMYASSLDVGALVREIGFTPHNFSNHCRDIYKILSDILPDKFYKVYNKGSNLFLLLTAVLMHDYYMSQDASEEARRKHSELGKKFVEKEIFGKENTPLKMYCSKEFGEALADVIYAHSDIKDEHGGIDTYTFEKILEKYSDKRKKVKVDGEELNVPFVAGLLRFADELDISYERIEGTGYEGKINTEESKMHYEICKYFRPVQNRKDEEISIEIFEKEFENVPDDDKPAIAGQIINRFIKIKKEFDYLRKEVFFNNLYTKSEIWTIEKISLMNEEVYKEWIKKKVNGSIL